MSLTKKIKSILFEDSYNMYGSEYMSHPEAEEDQLTVHAELPIAPSAHANMQLTDSAPPVDDDVYVPVNNKELGSALTALALKVPDNFVANIYRQVKATILAAEQSAATLTTEPDEVQPEEEISERLNRLILKMSNNANLTESDWSQIKFGAQEEVEEEEAEDDADAESEREPDVVKGKYLAQYYRDRPGKDPSTHKGSGESTMVTGTGRLLQNVVKPLLDVPKDQLQDAVEYLRLQFRMLTRDVDSIPQEGPKTFSGMYLKKLVPKLNDDQMGNKFLTTVVRDFKGRNDKWLNDLAKKALAETESEKIAFQNLKDTLAKEDPAQVDLIDNLVN
ncbi:MAG: hypothetical protein H8E12_10565 [Rhodobacteraceae bacterium]|nr:hypothetical protein [Paracoccaceae bacterium]